jgi:PAS domain S-box-containing protein
MLDSRVEVMAQTSRGTLLPVELAISQVQADPPMFTGFVRDISDRRRRDEENERLATIVRSSEDAILSMDLEGRTMAWNDGAERIYGWSAEEAIGRSVDSLIVPPERLDEFTNSTAAALSGELVAIETQRCDRHGRIIDVSLRLIPMRDPSGRIVGVSSTAHDITDRRLREEREHRDREGREWRDRVEAALADDRLVFWAQPVVDPLSGKVDHHELLLRMDLDGQLIAPGQFLPHAERSSLITKIDRWAVLAGAELAREMPVAINLSARSIGDPRLLEHIKDAVPDPRIAKRIIFEITETAAAEHLAEAHDLVAGLTELGFGVALDDFGTGYGSFTYLKHLPVTELKIDMEFVRGLTDDTANQRIVRSLVDVAGNFNMRTVAEGVEDAPTLDLLRTLGVDLVQGYHLGRPAPLDRSTRRASRDRAKKGSRHVTTRA